MVSALFLKPLIAWGALAAAIPIIIYLVMRQRYKVVVWAAMDFLLAAYRKTRKRRKIEEMLLLAIRTLLMLLLPLGLAHPIWNAVGGAGSEDVHRVIVLDSSYSMGRRDRSETVFQQAKKAAQELIRRMEGKGWVTLLTADSLRTTQIAAEAHRNDLLSAEIDDLAPSHAGSDLLSCLKDVAKVLKERRAVVRQEVFLLTDMQSSAWTRVQTKDPELIQALDEIKKLARHVYVVDLGEAKRANMQISDFRCATQTLTPGNPVIFEVKVRNLSDSDSEPTTVGFYVGAGENASKRGEETVPALAKNQSHVVTFTTTFDVAGSYALSATLPPDPLLTDNTHFVSVAAREKIRVLLVDGEPGGTGRRMDDETYFLEVALGLDAQLSPFAVTRRISFDFSADVDLARNEAVVLANMPPFPEQVALLDGYVRDGGVLIVSAGNNVARDATWYNSVLHRDGAGLLPARILGVEEFQSAQSGASFGLRINTDHPVARAKGIQWQMLGQVKVRRLLKVEPSKDPPAGTMVDFIEILRDGPGLNAYPALVEKQYGLGRVIFFASGLDTDWGDFPGEFSFPILWYEVLYHATKASHRHNIGVGEPFEMVFPPEKLSANVQIQRMDAQAPPPVTAHLVNVENRAKLVWPEESSTDVRLRESGTAMSGIYRVTVEGSPEPQVLHVAVNVDSEEGDLTRKEKEEVEAVFGPEFPVSVCTGAGELWQRMSSKGSQSDLWKPLLAIVFVLLCLETVLAWRFGRQ